MRSAWSGGRVLSRSAQRWISGKQQYGLVNCSDAGPQNALEVWEAFTGSGRSDADDDYEDYVEDVIERARTCDPRVFEDEESWWSRVFEEVELGALVPEDQ
ncbi:SUKH-4 family immunity protein [Streptomyces zaomyceticus]|uniref:SUKH-4 family immunity protein n=1 Tax=Streptomyces zaomyceticus TaxID=68286 RepID=UPI003723382E